MAEVVSCSFTQHMMWERKRRFLLYVRARREAIEMVVKLEILSEIAILFWNLIG